MNLNRHERGDLQAQRDVDRRWRSESDGFRPISYSEAASRAREDERIRKPHQSARNVRQPQRFPWRQSSDPERAMVKGKTHERFVEGEALRRSRLRLIELGLVSGDQTPPEPEPEPEPVSPEPECHGHIMGTGDDGPECVRCGFAPPRPHGKDYLVQLHNEMQASHAGLDALFESWAAE